MHSSSFVIGFEGLGDLLSSRNGFLAVIEGRKPTRIDMRPLSNSLSADKVRGNNLAVEANLFSMGGNARVLYCLCTAWIRSGLVTTYIFCPGNGMVKTGEPVS